MGSLVHTLADISSNMKFLVLAACVAVSSASLVTHPNGAVVPADEPAVAHARAAHLATKGAVYGYPYAYAGVYPYAYAGAYPYAYGAAYPYAYAGAYPYAYAGYPYGGLVAHPNGAVVPVDEPAVTAARAEHLAAHGVVAPYHALPYAAGVAYAGLVAHPTGAVVPVEPADVVAARAEH